GVLARFGDLPLLAEFRHAGWESPETIQLLRRRGAGFCNIDQPRLGSTLPPTAHVTGSVAYVRFHGRNARAWFAGDRFSRTATAAPEAAHGEEDGGDRSNKDADRASPDLGLVGGRGG